MRVQIINDVVVAYGKVFGEYTFEGAPNDYTFDTYTYTPEVAGVFDPNGFTKIHFEEE